MPPNYTLTGVTTSESDYIDPYATTTGPLLAEKPDNRRTPCQKCGICFLITAVITGIVFGILAIAGVFRASRIDSVHRYVNEYPSITKGATGEGNGDPKLANLYFFNEEVKAPSNQELRIKSENVDI